MCGIVGCAGNLAQAEKKMFRDMLLFDVVRGQDSTGVVGVNYSSPSSVSVAKDVGHPLNLWDIPATQSLFDARGVYKAGAKVLIGHNRAATVGSVTVDNAHPFNFGDIYGVHNGSLWDTNDLEGNFDVDSKEVFYTIHKKGIEHTWANLNGAAALVWWDKGEERLNLIRNKERPLFVAENKKRDCMFWASESWMIEVAAVRHKVELHEKPTSVPTNTLYSFSATAVNVFLKDEKELQESFYQGYTPGYYVGGSVPYAVQSNYSSPKPGRETVDEPDKESKINTTWAKGKKKADKEERGKKAEISYCVKTYVTPSSASGNKPHWKYYLVGKTQGGERVEIFPETPAVYERWAKIKREAGTGKIVIKINSRPRYAIDHQNKTTFYAAAANISLVGIEREKVSSLVHDPKEVMGDLDDDVIPFPNPDKDDKTYRGYGQKKFSSYELAREIKKAGECCAHCDKLLDVEDEIDWVQPDIMLCDECATNPFVQQCARNM